MITVYGHSDDLIEVGGDVREEFDVHNTPVWLVVSDGTVLEVVYDGCWHVGCVANGEGECVRTFTATDPDALDYSDVMTVSGTITGVRLAETKPVWKGIPDLRGQKEEAMGEKEVTTYLYSDSGGSDKWYCSQLLQEKDGSWRHLCRSGRRYASDVVQANNTYDGYGEALSKHEAVVKSKMKGGSAYRPVAPSYLGFTESTDVVVPEPVPGVFAKEVISPPMLFSPIDRAKMLELLEDDGYLTQRKMNGTRLQVVLAADKAQPFQALNKEGTVTPVPMSVVTALTALVRNSTGEERFDGELIGGVFHVFDRPVIAGESGKHFLARSLAVALMGSENPAVQSVPAAIGTTAKQAMLARSESEGWEGLVLKRRDGLYKPGRSRDDYKWKDVQTLEAYLTALNTTSKGENSARMEIPTSGGLRPIGNVTLPASVERASGGRISREDLQGLIRKASGAPLVIGEVSALYFDLTALHQPVLLRLRDDVSAVPSDQELKGKEGKRVTWGE